VRLGIFGGTFDPPHNGHLLSAVDAAETLALDVVWFVPNATQPLKGPGHGAPEHRLEMVRLMVGGDPRFAVDPIEIQRPGPSYTIETVAVFAERFPDAARFLLIGADVVSTFEQWRNPEGIRALAELVILHRTVQPPGEPRAIASPHLQNVPAVLRDARWLETRCIELSSTEIRARVRDGKSIRGFVPDPVAAYIAATGLYQ
jgi:nicotinate-nucleotide adenylyltransferase